MGFVEYSVFSHAMCQKSLGCLSQTFSRAAAEQTTLRFVAFCGILFMALPINGKRFVPLLNRGRYFLPPVSCGKGGCLMVTYADLFQYTMVLIGLVGLFIAAWNIKK